MFWKFWLPMLLLGGMYILGKRHARRGTPSEPFSLTPERRAMLYFRPIHQNALRTTSVTLAMIVVTVIGWFVYRDWSEAHQVVEVRVVHVQTMKSSVYQAQRNKIQGRSFVTLDGRRIALADVERMEIEELP
jgi:hypothetical protein